MKIANIYSGVLSRIMLRVTFLYSPKVTFLYSPKSPWAFLLSYNLIT